jgi:hypothetical protein
MKLVIDKELPRPCSMLALHAKGWWGDMDEQFMDNRQFPDTDEGQAQALIYARMYTRLTGVMGRDMETIEDMQEWLEHEKIVDENSVLEIPGNDQEMLPSVEEVRVLLYDKDGRTFKMKLGY